MTIRTDILGAALLTLLLTSFGDARAQDLDCLDCHSPDISESMHFMLGSSHWDKSNAATPGSKDGCRACHGASDRHRNLPTQIQPHISYGPKWTASIDAQNGMCLDCHAETAHGNWSDGKHATENLTCVTCHDAHAEDVVRTPAGQAGVCTVCHKVQKEGVHSFAGSEGEDPPCSQCHDPHADPAPETTLLASRSEGCRACHDLQAMANDPLVSDSAKNYHKIMVGAERTCIDCHRGVIHDAGHQAPVAQPAARPSDELTLFYPGNVSAEWLTTRHPGAQPLRQGSRSCRECHQGDAAAMAQELGASTADATRDVTMSFARRGDQLDVTVAWTGPGTRSVSVMFGSDADASFAVGGCFAACHDNMTGMSRQRDQGHTKYLWASLQQQRSIGRPALRRDEATLADMRAEGRYAELWRAQITDGELTAVETFTVLTERSPDADPSVTASVRHAEDHHSVTFSRALASAALPIVAGEAYTLGVAVHEPGTEGASHWVSLPITFSLDRSDTDFVVAR